MKHFVNQILWNEYCQGIEKLVLNKLNDEEQLEILKKIHMLKFITDNFQDDEIFNWETLIKKASYLKEI